MGRKGIKGWGRQEWGVKQPNVSHGGKRGGVPRAAGKGAGVTTGKLGGGTRSKKKKMGRCRKGKHEVEGLGVGTEDQTGKRLQLESKNCGSKGANHLKDEGDAKRKSRGSMCPEFKADTRDVQWTQTCQRGLGLGNRK